MTAGSAVGAPPARVLVVDDELRSRLLLEVMLAREDVEILMATGGEEALAMIASDPPDLILLDIMMNGLNGYQVAERIKANPETRHIPIIMVTALDDHNVRMLGLQAGAEDLVTKPVDRQELVARVRNLLNLKAYGDSQHVHNQVLAGEVAAHTADLERRTRQAAVLAEQTALVNLAQDAIVVRDMNDQILFWGRGAELMYGWSSEMALGASSMTLLRTDFFEPFEQLRATLLRDGVWEGEAVQYKRDGTRMNVATRWTLQRDGAGVPFRILTISNDISSRKAADDERLLLTDRLSLAVAVARLGVWEWRMSTGELYWDATMFDIYDLPPAASMPYDSWAKTVHPEDRPAVEATLHKAIDEKGQGAAEFRIITPTGAIKNVSIVMRAVVDDRGTVVRVIGVNMDITDRKKSEQALERLRHEQLQFKDDFLSHVSHELRSPLTAIKQFTSILLGGLAGELNKEQREYQEIVLKNIHQLQSMVDDLLEVTRLETGKLTVDLENMSVGNAVTDAIDTLKGAAAAKSIALLYDPPANLGSAYADPTRVRQILIILLDNAIKFTPAGGTVTVRTGPDRDPGFLRLEVADTGCGIGTDRIDRLFERLYQVSERTGVSRKGLGLGLYICRELVARQGGRIAVESRVDQGSTFSFTVPVFSLNAVIGPLLRHNEWPRSTVALIVLDLGTHNAAASRECQDASPSEVRSLVDRCLMPDQDRLLPRMNFRDERDYLFVIAFADDRGASVLTRRIREQLERHLRSEQQCQLPVVSYQMLAPPPHEAGASTIDLVTRMASSLETVINAHINAEAR